MLAVSNLYYDYPDKCVLKDVNFSLLPGKLLHLRGENGSGKTTLLKILSGLLQPEQGEIRYEGKLISNDLAAYQQILCYIGHKTGISQLLTVAENCQFGMHYKPSVNLLNQLFQQFDLEGLEDVPCSLLSAGQKRRAGLLRLALSGAPLWLLDEPLVALDQNAVKILMNCMMQHLDRQGLIVVTSHQTLPLPGIAYEEYSLC